MNGVRLLDYIDINKVKYKFETIEYKFNQDNYFSIKAAKLVYDNKPATIVLLGSLDGRIDRTYIDFYELKRMYEIYNYVIRPENVDYINELSNLYNHMDWFLFNDVPVPQIKAYKWVKGRIRFRPIPRKFTIDEIWADEQHTYYRINRIYKTCQVLKIHCKEYTALPIWHIYGNTKDRIEPIMCHFNILRGILIKLFPRFKEWFESLEPLLIDIQEFDHDDTEKLNLEFQSKENIINLFEEKNNQNKTRDLIKTLLMDLLYKHLMKLPKQDARNVHFSEALDKKLNELIENYNYLQLEEIYRFIIGEYNYGKFKIQYDIVNNYFYIKNEKKEIKKMSQKGLLKVVEIEESEDESED